MNEYNMGGLIPDPSYDLRRRIEKLEARLAEMEKEMLELEKGKAEPDVPWRDRWAPEYMVHLESEMEPDKNLEMLDRKAGPYIRQLQWLFEHYPEQNGEWSKDTQWFLYHSKDYEGWCCGVAWKTPNLSLIYMSEEAAKHLAADMNSGKVRFHESF